MRVTLERLITAINRLTHAIEALLRIDWGAKQQREADRD